jgi:hypothetical protein
MAKPERPEDPGGKKPDKRPERVTERHEERRLARETRIRERGTVEVDGVTMDPGPGIEEFVDPRPDPITRPEADARRDRITVVLPRERLGEFAEVLKAKYPERRSPDVLAEWLVERLDAELGS